MKGMPIESQTEKSDTEISTDEPRRFSTMENTVLGIVWKRGPCTTYSVMKELQSSTSTFFRDWAGTVYPIVKRLLKTGHLNKTKKRGPRSEVQISISDSGIAELERWLTGKIEVPEVAQTVDLLRLRVFYLGVIKAEDRVAFIDEAIIELHRHIARCKQSQEIYEKSGDPFSALATGGTIAESEVRIAWLSSIREIVQTI